MSELYEFMKLAGPLLGIIVSALMAQSLVNYRLKKHEFDMREIQKMQKEMQIELQQLSLTDKDVQKEIGMNEVTVKADFKNMQSKLDTIAVSVNAFTEVLKRFEQNDSNHIDALRKMLKEITSKQDIRIKAIEDDQRKIWALIKSKF
jgi:chaperonin cofactor prefoldin